MSAATGVAVNVWSQCDLRAWSGLVVGTFDGSNITMPAFNSSASGPTAGVYRHAESFLSGQGSPAWSVTTANQRTMAADLDTESSGDIPDAVIDIDPETGRLRFSSATVQLKITACTNPAAFGLRAADLPTSLAASYVAPDDFSRDLLTSETITFGSDVDATLYTVPSHVYEARVMHLIRPTTAAAGSPLDAHDDAGTLTLAYALNTAVSETQNRVRVCLDDEDRVVITWPTAISATAPVWTDESFAARLGIAGVASRDEFGVVDGLARFRGHRPVEGCAPFPLGLAAPYQPLPEHEGQSRYLHGQGAAGYSVGSRTTYTLEAFTDSVRSAWHQTRAMDLEEHLARRFEPYARPPRPVTIVFNHDWRPYLNPNGWTASTPGASRLYSTTRYTSARAVQRAPNDAAMRPDFSRNGVHARVRMRVTDAAE